MKPLMLHLEAFGPYVSRQSIDFSKLDSRGLLLIHGPTGSGKTTIFDGICAALYGKTSVGRDVKDMRSQKAPDNIRTRVELEFETGQKRYRVAREPEQHVLGQRGQLIHQTPRAELYQVGARGETCLATGQRDVDAQVQEILGLKAAQFCRVVMLPQGRFEAMLQAKPDDREADLSVLFQTSRYEIIQSMLRARAKEAGEAIDRDQQRRETLLQSVDCQTANDLTERVRAQQEELRQAEAQRADLANRDKRAQTALSAAETTQRKLDEKAAAETTLRTLEAEKPSRDQQRTSLDRAARAAELADAVAARDERRREARESRDRLTTAEVQLGKAQAEKAQATSALELEERRSEQREVARNEAQRLRGLAPQVAKLVTATEALEQAQAAASDALEQCKEAARRVTAAEKNHVRAQDRLARLEADAAGLAGLEAEVKSAGKTIELRQRLDEARQQQSAASREADAARKKQADAEARLDKARKQLDKAREDRMRGIAAELAADLAAGEPCPVCGSTKHPAKARRARGTVTTDQINALQEKADAAQKALKAAQRAESAAQRELAATSKEVETLQSALGKANARAGVSRLESSLDKQRTALDRARKATAEVKDLRVVLRSLDRELKGARSEADTAAKQEASAAKQAAAAAARVEELGRLVDTRFRAPGALDKAITRQEKLLRDLEATLKEARDRLAKAEKYFAAAEQTVKSEKSHADKATAAGERAQADLQRRLQRAGFASEKDYTSAIMSARDADKLRADLDRYDKQVVAAKDRLQKAAAAAAGLEPPDIAGFRRVCDEIRTAIQECDTQTGKLRERLQQLDKTAGELAELARRLETREREHNRLQRLADLATGKAPANPGFHRFVLGYRLDEVLMHANRRLTTMSGDRYRLLRATDGDGKTAMRAGLNLEVSDAFTGKVRPVETLSGGETFIAALALALGLSDAVQSRSGGIRLDTVFIDEGFGALDPEALDRAMEALLLLREGGRLVGIISHVAELRERIRDTRLEVTTANGASRARLVLS